MAFLFSVSKTCSVTQVITVQQLSQVFHPQTCIVCNSHQEEWEFVLRLHGIQDQSALRGTTGKMCPQELLSHLVTVSEIRCVGCGFTVQSVKHEKSFFCLAASLQWNFCKFISSLFISIEISVFFSNKPSLAQLLQMVAALFSNLG